jgi:ketosteroid isomerase-like protein
MTRTPTEAFLGVLHGVCERRLEDLPQFYAEETNVLHPFHPERAPALRTREELREHFRRGLSTRPEVRREPRNVRIHETTDPEVVIGEFEYHSTIVDTGETFDMPAIFVMRVRNGEIVESRDYADHALIARVFASASGSGR